MFADRRSMAAVRTLDKDPWLASEKEIQNALRDAARLESWVAQRRGEWVRALDEKHAYLQRGAKSPAAWLASETGLSPVEANRQAKSAAVLHTLSEADEALRMGKISPSHVDLLAKTADDDTLIEALARDERELVHNASKDTVEQFRRRLLRWKRCQRDDDGGLDADQLHEKRSGKKISDDDGLQGIRALWPAAQSEEFWSILDRFLRARWNGIHSDEPSTKDLKQPQVVADALLDMARLAGGRDRDKMRLPRSSVRVVIDYETLLRELHEHSICELDDGTALSPETVRHLACNAGILPVVLDGAGQVLDYGRVRHLATPSQVDALRIRDGGCFIEHCDAHVSWCEAHHIEWWRHEGQTDLDNLILACPKHHHMIHEGGWKLRRGSDGCIVVANPAGLVVQRSYSQAQQRRPQRGDTSKPTVQRRDQDWRRTGRGRKNDHRTSRHDPPVGTPPSATPGGTSRSGRKNDHHQNKRPSPANGSGGTPNTDHRHGRKIDQRVGGTSSTNGSVIDDVGGNGRKIDQTSPATPAEFESEGQRKDRQMRAVGLIFPIDDDGTIKRPGCWEPPPATV